MTDWEDTWGTGERFRCDSCGGVFVRLYSDVGQQSAVDVPVDEWRDEYTSERVLVDVDPMHCIDCEMDDPS